MISMQPGEMRASPAYSSTPPDYMPVAEVTEVLPDICEHIRMQLESAYEGYLAITDELFGGSPVDANEMVALFEVKDQEWLGNGTYKYAAELAQRTRTSFTLIATPCLSLTESRLAILAKNFGVRQPRATHVDSEFYQSSSYDSRLLCGPPSPGHVRFSLIPNYTEDDLEYRSAATQLEMVQKRQLALPGITLLSPSILDAITYWYTLRAQGDALRQDGTFANTHICHFEHAHSPEARRRGVPFTCIQNDGMPLVTFLTTEEAYGARIALG